MNYSDTRKRDINLSSDAFNSSTPSRKADPSNIRDKHKMLVVFPVPGGPFIFLIILFHYFILFNLI